MNFFLGCHRHIILAGKRFRCDWPFLFCKIFPCWPNSQFVLLIFSEHSSRCCVFPSFSSLKRLFWHMWWKVGCTLCSIVMQNRLNPIHWLVLAVMVVSLTPFPHPLRVRVDMNLVIVYDSTFARNFSLTSIEKAEMMVKSWGASPSLAHHGSSVLKQLPDASTSSLSRRKRRRWRQYCCDRLQLIVGAEISSSHERDHRLSMLAMNLGGGEFFGVNLFVWRNVQYECTCMVWLVWICLDCSTLCTHISIPKCWHDSMWVR